MQNSINYLKIGGVAIWIGAVFPQPAVQLNAEYIIRNILSIKGLHNYNNEDFINAVNFIEANYSFFDFQSLIKKGFDLDEVQAVFNMRQIKTLLE
jgi:alcohol dehydrogenase